MARLTTQGRKALSRSQFALPAGDKGSRGRPAFPIPDASHARAALRDVGRAIKAGDITKAQERTVQRKARAKLKKG